ncbi:MAG: GPR endopeptidase [Defluviitaleaceae bacterium]|nr:GPR endopeptidase [Defluviitaleaceae bacterium]
MNKKHEIGDGFVIKSEETELCKSALLQIKNKNGEKAMGMPVGHYLTIETGILECGRNGRLEEVAKTVSEHLVKMMKIPDDAPVLVVGFGERNMITSCLGARVVDKIFVTRHLVDEARESLGIEVRPVSVITPGVTDSTGISTAEIIKSICDATKPSLVITIDSLAAQEASGLCSKIQIRDTGITLSYGSPENPNKQVINPEYLGIPMVSIGIPTVINAADIIVDAMNRVFPDRDTVDAELLENIHRLSDTMFASSSPYVATKDIDAAIHYSAYVISAAINTTLFKENWPQAPYS